MSMFEPDAFHAILAQAIRSESDRFNKISAAFIGGNGVARCTREVYFWCLVGVFAVLVGGCVRMRELSRKRSSRRTCSYDLASCLPVALICRN